MAEICAYIPKISVLNAHSYILHQYSKLSTKLILSVLGITTGTRRQHTSDHLREREREGGEERDGGGGGGGESVRV